MFRLISAVSVVVVDNADNYCAGDDDGYDIDELLLLLLLLLIMMISVVGRI